MKKSKTTEQEEVKTEETAEVKEEMPAVDAKLQETEALAEDYKRKWYAVTAEYDNYRKRTALTASQKYNEGKGDTILKILPIGDNLERALAVCEDEKMKQGLEMVKASFDKILADEGIEAFDPTGEEFNSTTSTAIMAMPCEEGESEGMVKQTFLKGYKMGDKILRYAQVIVTQ